ncbi:hypothetical protein [Hydrogenimonas cancrithermarum]|uniref:Phage holin family protein n=1 Tax=Hydrogenimonas cancrithermarum TaxID=2993563 RepID=A0ABN6WYK5_9BACT|nr:hypothetical protein [Hydrogenimonas cancrithermarum]BDY13320.1 hypothetical protein HCR_16320 [Hydrogenimonas cancrithermarum]
MSKVTVSDFIIALMDLLEAESRAFQESAELFMQRQRESLRDTLYRSGWMVGWIAAAFISLLGALAFLTWGFYRLFALYVSETAAPFVAGALLLLFALLFARFATNSRLRE